MKGFAIAFTSGISLGLVLSLASLAEAKTVSIDFTGATPVSQGLTQVNSERDKDGATTLVQRGGKNVAMTGNTDASRYLYLKIDDPAFKQGLEHVWLTVEYFDEGKDGFKVEYDGQDDAHTAAIFRYPTATARVKFDTKVFTHQTWHLTGFKLEGGEEGGADLRIDDRAGDDVDGAEFIAKVTVSDEDPDFVHIPYAVNKITIDGVANTDEWDGAYTVVLDKAQQDENDAKNWAGPEDFSGTYSLKWDESALYMRGQVIDATPRLNTIPNASGNDAPGHYWAGDGMEIYIGLDDSDPEITTGMIQGSDFKLMVGLGDPTRWSVADPDHFNEPIDLGEIKSNMGIVNTEKGYDFELRIPWNIANNGSVKPGQRIRWTMAANNSKVTPSDQQVILQPTGRGNFNVNMSAWLRTMLDPKP